MKPMIRSILLLAAASAVAAAARPNILLVYIDDLKPMTRDYGEAHMHTPNFDRLAASGLRFESAYCQVPTCGASRASLMTSVYPTKERFPNFKCWAEKDAPGRVTLPQRFREAGYTTVSNGKVFHHKEDTADRSWSETPWRPETTGTTFHNPETKAFFEKTRQFRKGPKGQKQKKRPMFEQSRIPTLESHDGTIAAKTMKDLERLGGSGKPFFIACGFAKPHMPFYAPAEAWEPYRLPKIGLAPFRERPADAPAALRQVTEQFAYIPATHDFARVLKYNTDPYHRHMRQGYYACVTHADKLLGMLLDKLDSLKLADNTVVVVLGDHGWILGEHNEWAKNQLYPEALRTALWMKGPGVSHGAAKTFVEFVDIHPTLCDVAGIPYDKESINGRSFAAVLADPSAGHRDHAYTRFGPGDAITTDGYFFSRWNTPEQGKQTLLIDLKKDPLGKRNVAADPENASVIHDMERKLADKISRAKQTS